MTEVSPFLLVDRNRGTLERNTTRGVTVIEFSDAPGLYYDRKGNPLSDELAADAGFDVLRSKIERRKRQKIAEVTREAESEAAELLAEAESEAESEVLTEMGLEPPPGDPPPGEPSEPEGDGGPTIERAGRKWNVKDASGEVVSEGLTKAEAEDLVTQLLGG